MNVNYSEIIDFIYTNGSMVGPRGKQTIEVLGASITVPHWLYINRLGSSFRLIATETMMMMGGIFDIGLLEKASPGANIELFKKQSDYGPRIMSRGNWQRAFNQLVGDPDTRRSIIYLNNMDQPQDDLACTTSIQFLHRNNQLHAFVAMRSWDAVYGLPADLFMFGNLLRAMSYTTGIPAGNVTVQVASLHIYETTASKAKLDSTMVAHWNEDFMPCDFAQAAKNIANREANSMRYWDMETLPNGNYIEIGGI